MNCETMILLMNSQLDGESSPSDRDILQNHLQNCPQCREMYQQMEENDKELRKSLLPVPTNLSSRIMDAVRKDAAKRKRRIWSYSLSGIAVAAVLILVLFGGSNSPVLPAHKDITMRSLPSVISEPTKIFEPRDFAIDSEAFRSQTVTEAMTGAPVTGDIGSFSIEGDTSYALASDKKGIETTDQHAVVVLPRNILTNDLSGKRLASTAVDDLNNPVAAAYLQEEDISVYDIYEVDSEIFSLLMSQNGAKVFLCNYSPAPLHYWVILTDAPE